MDIEAMRIIATAVLEPIWDRSIMVLENMAEKKTMKEVGGGKGKKKG